MRRASSATVSSPSSTKPGGAPALARVTQKPDGRLDVSIESAEPAEALLRLRFVLAADDDHTEFLRRFRDDPLIGNAVRTLEGMRPIRTATVTHSLLKAVCGQLIEAKAARVLEGRLVRLASREHEGLRLPPQRHTFQRFTRADLARHGLVSRKGSALLRLTRELDLERLHGVSTDVAARRIERERGLGPWSAGMVCLFGLGRYECGLVGDLGLVKLRLGAARPLGRDGGDARAPRALRRMGRPGQRVHALEPEGLLRRAQRREEDDVADRLAAGEQHGEPVDAEAEAGRRRHPVGERLDVVGVVSARRRALSAKRAACSSGSFSSE